MGDGADAALEWAARNMRDPFKKRPSGRNAIAARCPYCKKGIRPNGGDIRASLDMHLRAKHPEIFDQEQTGGSNG